MTYKRAQKTTGQETIREHDGIKLVRIGTAFYVFEPDGRAVEVFTTPGRAPSTTDTAKTARLARRFFIDYINS